MKNYWLDKTKWSFEEALKGTIKGKYETEHIKVVEIENLGTDYFYRLVEKRKNEQAKSEEAS